MSIAVPLTLERPSILVRVDLEALARCLTYEPISQVSNAIACGIGAPEFGGPDSRRSRMRA